MRCDKPLVRVFLEKSIKAYAESEEVAIPRKAVGKHTHLSDCLFWFRDHVQAIDRSTYNVAKDFTSTNHPDKFHLGQEWLDNMLHNHHFSASSDEVHGMWDRIVQIPRFILKGI